MATGDRYPRLRAWEFLWDWVLSHGTWKSLAATRSRQQTALHLGLYLANWGMFRGSSKLLQVNLDYFEALTVHLFDGKQVPLAFWDLQLRDFAPTSPSYVEAAQLFDEGAKRISDFEAETVGWTPTRLSKVLLGLWGQLPAYDTYFNRSWRRFTLARPDLGLPRHLWVNASSLGHLARAQAQCGWKLGGYTTFHAEQPYPPGKIIDMAFFQDGYER